MHEKSITFRIYTKKTQCILPLISYSLFIKIWKISKSLYSVSKHNTHALSSDNLSVYPLLE